MDIIDKYNIKKKHKEFIKQKQKQKKKKKQIRNLISANHESDS